MPWPSQTVCDPLSSAVQATSHGRAVVVDPVLIAAVVLVQIKGEVRSPRPPAPARIKYGADTCGVGVHGGEVAQVCATERSRLAGAGSSLLLRAGLWTCAAAVLLLAAQVLKHIVTKSCMFNTKHSRVHCQAET